MKGKKALVTGASEGIGREFARKLASEGYEVTAVARNENRLQHLINDDIGHHHHYIVADLSTEAGQNKISEELTHKHYDLLVNNAGFGTYGSFTEVSLDKQQEMMRLNCNAVVKLSYAFLKNANKDDALINVSSTLAFLPFPQSGLYAATKAFVTSFSESLWYEYKGRGIYVMDLCPGITSTQFHHRAGGKEGELPKNLTQTPQQVVEVALRELKARKKPTVISGVKNVMFATLARVMPRKSTVSMMGGMR